MLKLAVQGVFNTDLKDINYDSVRFVSDLGFKGLCTHITVPAAGIAEATWKNARDVIAAQGLAYLQIWGRYPSIISRDESVRRAGVQELRDLCVLCSKMGVPGVGLRPTSRNPRGDWWPHPENYLPETEDLLVRSIREVAQTAADLGLTIVLECHQTSTLDTPATIRRVVERSDPQRVKVNLDLCNFVTDIRTAFHPQAMLRDAFATLAPHTAAVHVKDYFLEDRLVCHISETVLGTGLMDWDTLLMQAHQHTPDTWLVIEHLPIAQIPHAKANLAEMLKRLGV